MKKFLNEFKEFASRGDVMNLAVGIIIGGAFQAIVNSLVNDIVSPTIGLFLNMDFSHLMLKIGDVEIRYGAFLTAVINFILKQEGFDSTEKFKENIKNELINKAGK